MEQRLIDANALKNDINAQVAILNAMSVSTGIDELRQIGEELQQGMVAEIDKQPTVDAVQVVRCRECEHRIDVDGLSKSGYFCERFHYSFDMENCDDFFCADGERRSDGK